MSEAAIGIGDVLIRLLAYDCQAQDVRGSVHVNVY